MKKLQLPPTIRPAHVDEVPNDPLIIANIEAGNRANIVEGYVVHSNTSRDLPFDFFAEINVDNSNLWLLFKALVLAMPSEQSFIFGHVDAEPHYSPYQSKASLLNHIERFEKELSQDGFLEFGTIYQDEAMLNEVFVKKAKYIQFWGTDRNSFNLIMEEYSLHERQDLNFVDEYPLVTESLDLYDSNAYSTAEIINSFKDSFRI